MGVKSIWHKSFTIFRETFKQSQCPLYKIASIVFPNSSPPAGQNILARFHPLPGFLVVCIEDAVGVSGIAGGLSPLHGYLTLQVR